MLKFKVAIASFLFTVCAIGSVADAQFSLLPPSKSFEQERAEVAKQHEQVKAEFGGEVDNKELSAYVSRVGQIVARNSDFPDKPFTFTVLDNPTPNAFTVGGGYVYITRGMLGLMNDEAELVGVLAHECGHVTARHSARRESRMKWQQYETGVLALLTRSPLLVGAKNLGDSASFLGYSRKQERQADDLGFKTLNKAGYDVDGMTNMLSSLQRFVRLQATIAGQSQAAAEPPAWLSDHPATDDRIRNMSLKASLAKLVNPDQTKTNQQAYLSAIDGLIYGEDPKQGVVRDTSFYHTGMNFAFDVPDGFQIQNKPQAVIGAKGDTLAMIFSGMDWPADRTLEQYLANTWQKLTAGSSGPIGAVEKTEINGLPAIVVRKSVDLRSLLGDATLDLQTFIYRHSENVVMHMSFISLAEDTAKHQRMIDAMGNSFRLMTDKDKQASKPYRVTLVDVTPDVNMASLSEKMPFSRFNFARFRAINGLEGDKDFRQRKRVKVILKDQ